MTNCLLSSEVDYGSNSVVIVERGCAKQAYEHQALVRGKWRTIVTIMVSSKIGDE